MINNQGQFIVVEGLEGAGKSSAVHTIKEFLNDNSIEVLLTREPGGTAIGEVIRRLIKEKNSEPMDPKTELLLLYASRIELLKKKILPALQDGYWVVADRFELSSWAYQGYGRQLDLQFLTELSSFSLNLFKPNLTLFLEVSLELGLKRARARGETDRIEQESFEFFKSVYIGYHKQLKIQDHVHILNAEKPLDEVQLDIKEILQRYLNHLK